MNKFELSHQLKVEKEKPNLTEKEKIDNIWQRAKDFGLEHIVSKGKYVYRVILGSALLLGAQNLAAKNLENKNLEENKDEIKKYISNFDQTGSHQETLAELTADIENRFANLSNPDLSAYTQELNGTINKNIEGSEILNNDELGDIQVSVNSYHIQSENNSNLESSFGSKIDLKKMSEEEIRGMGIILEAVGKGSTKQEAILQALNELSKKCQADVHGIQKNLNSENNNLISQEFLQVTEISGLNSFENVKVLKAEQVGDIWSVQLQGEVGEKVE